VTEILGRPATWLLLLMAGLVATAGPAVAQAAGSPAGTTRRVPVEGGAYIDVSPAGLASMPQGKRFPLINVHIPYEGEIEGTDRFIPFDQVEANLDRLPADKAARIVLYCRSGHMSTITAQALVKRGYTDVWNLEGGMIAWEQAGYRLVHRPR